MQMQRQIASPGSGVGDEDQGEDGDVMETMYIMKVRGTILPEACRELFHVVRYLQQHSSSMGHSNDGDDGMKADAQWKSTVITKDTTAAFNVAALTSSHTIKEVRWNGARETWSVISDKKRERSSNCRRRNGNLGGGANQP